MTSKYENV